MFLFSLVERIGDSLGKVFVSGRGSVMSVTVPHAVVVSVVVSAAYASGSDRARADPVEVDVGVLQGQLLDLGREVFGRRRVHHLDDFMMLGRSVLGSGERGRCGSRSVVHRSRSVLLGWSVDLVRNLLGWRWEGRNDLGSLVDWPRRSWLRMEDRSWLRVEGRAGWRVEGRTGWCMEGRTGWWAVGLGRRSVDWSRCRSRSVVDWWRRDVLWGSVGWRWWW